MALLVKFNTQLIRRPAKFIYQYAKQFALDYRDALIESGKKAVKHPIKTIFYSSTAYLLFHAYHTMPSFNSYKNDLLAFQQQQLLTSSLIRNKQIEIYLDTIEQLLAHDQIHFVDCYLFSLIVYRSQYRSKENAYKLYENNCSYLHLKRNARIIDIGIFNRWLILNRQLRQADIFDDINNKKIAL
jgi:hypothetical protein